MRKLVLVPSKTCHCRSVSVFCVPNGFSSWKVLPQSVDEATVKLSSRSMLCSPEYAMGAHECAGDAWVTSPTEISESPPPVPASGCWTGDCTNEIDPSGHRFLVMRQKFDPRPVGAET